MSSSYAQKVPKGVLCRIFVLGGTQLSDPSYISDLSAICGLALISTTPRYQAPVLRDFLQRYITCRVFLGVSMVNSQSTQERLSD